LLQAEVENVFSSDSGGEESDEDKEEELILQLK
jgi:hypothetical protein